MQNFFKPGNVVDVVAPKDLASGEGVAIGKIFGFAGLAAKSGTVVPLQVEGSFVIKRAAGYTPTAGAVAGFDAATQTLLATGGLTIGYVVGPSPDDATYSIVKLIPSTA